MRQTAIQGFLSRFRRSPTTSFFDRFLADLNRALSALFSKIRPQKIGGSKGGWAPLSANPACAAMSRGNKARNEQIGPIPSPPRSIPRPSVFLEKLLQTVESFGFENWVFGTGFQVFGTTCWMFGTGSWVFGSAVGEIPTPPHPPTSPTQPLPTPPHPIPPPSPPTRPALPLKAHASARPF